MKFSSGPPMKSELSSRFKFDHNLSYIHQHIVMIDMRMKITLIEVKSSPKVLRGAETVILYVMDFIGGPH